MDKQTKWRYIFILQYLIKLKWLTWDKNAVNVIESNNAKIYAPQLEDLQTAVYRMAHRYGIDVGQSDVSLADSDDYFMTDYDNLYARFESISDGYSEKETPFNEYMSVLASLLESGEDLKVLKKGNVGNFYVATSKVFRFDIGGLTYERIPFLLRLVRKIIQHPSAFRLYDPDDNIIFNGNMNTKYIGWMFVQYMDFTENGSYIDIKVPFHDPPQISSQTNPSREEINTGFSDEYEIIY